MITEPIASKDQAIAYLNELVATGCVYHPDDAASTVLNGNTGSMLFTDEEAVIADEQMTRCFELIGEEAIYSIIAPEQPE